MQAGGRVKRGSSLVIELAERAGACFGLDPSTYDAAYVAAQLPAFSLLFGPDRYFDTVVHGLDTVPEDPCLLVSNHSGGTTVLDGFGLAAAWYHRFGVGRPLRGLIHEVPFAVPAIGRYLERCGMLRARPEAARRVLREVGHDVLVMPGGDRDVWRPARDRYRVRFGGRIGYARTAIEAQAPVVPVAHVGAHHTLHVLTDGRRLARSLGLYRVVRAEVLPVSLALPWGLSVLPLPHLPPPTRFEYRLGAPVRPPEVLSVESVKDLDADVRRSIARALDEMRREDRDTGRRRLLANVRRLERARDVRALAEHLRKQAALPGAQRPR